jgi:hypothetical protein
VRLQLDFDSGPDPPRHTRLLGLVLLALVLLELLALASVVLILRSA